MAQRGSTPEVRAQVAAALRRTRESRGWSPRELGLRINGNPDDPASTVYQIERGHTGMSLNVLFSLVEALGCTWAEVLGPEPGSEGDHGIEWRAGFRAGIGEAHAAVSKALQDAER